MIDIQALPIPQVLGYFEALAAIPHPSRHTKAVSDYCCRFAEEKGLKYRQDKANNVIIWKKGSDGRENEPAVLLQGHLDMVPAVAEGVTFDFLHDSLKLDVDGDWLHASGTTLGGDDGIAVAMCLALLADDTLSHPPLVCVFTTDEEIGLLGAMALDMSDIQAAYMLNLDSEAEGILTISCAGGVTARAVLPVPAGALYETDTVPAVLSLTGLVGGHSGVEIQKGRGNANRLMCEILLSLQEVIPSLGLSDISGGNADNAIPNRCVSRVVIPASATGLLQEKADQWEKIIRDRFPLENDIRLECNLPTESGEEKDVFFGESLKAALCSVLAMPDGVQTMTPGMEDHVESSLNLGILQREKDSLVLSFSIRSSIAEKKQGICNRVEAVARSIGGTVSYSGNYPGWPVKEDSSLVKLCCDLWKERTGKEMIREATHGGLECGVFSAGIPGIDIVSYGPDMRDIHTPKERLSISSCARIWEYTLAILEQLNRSEG